MQAQYHLAVQLINTHICHFDDQVKYSWRNLSLG